MRLRIWRRAGLIVYRILLPLIRVYALKSRPRARVIIVCGTEALVVENWLSSGKWALPGGGIKKTEEPKSAAIREIAEELGIRLDAQTVESLGFHSIKQENDITSNYYLFAAEVSKKPDVTLQRHEIMNYRWIAIADLLSPDETVLSSVRQSMVAWSQSRNLL